MVRTVQFERERKWLVDCIFNILIDLDPSENIDIVHIEQFYTEVTKTSVVRYRREKRATLPTLYFKCIKAWTTDMPAGQSQETTIEISQKDYYLTKLMHNVTSLNKTRVSIIKENIRFDIDAFRSDLPILSLDGEYIYMLEVEFGEGYEDNLEEYELPDYIKKHVLAEVTCDKKFTNMMLFKMLGDKNPENLKVFKDS